MGGQLRRPDGNAGRAQRRPALLRKRRSVRDQRGSRSGRGRRLRRRRRDHRGRDAGARHGPRQRGLGRRPHGLALVGGGCGRAALAPHASYGEQGLTALGQDLRLLDPVLARDAALLADRLADALHVGTHPGGNLIEAGDAQAVEAGLDGRIDALNALEVVPLGSCGRRRDGRLRGRSDGTRRRGRSLHGLGRSPELCTLRLLQRDDLGQGIDAPLGGDGSHSRRRQAAPDDARQSRPQEIGCRHQQQGLSPERDHHAHSQLRVPQPAVKTDRSRCGCTTATRPRSRTPMRAAATRSACQRGSPFVVPYSFLPVRRPLAWGSLQAHLGRTRISVRRFLARACAVVFDATGRLEPKPAVSTRSPPTPALIRQSATARARLVESRWL